MGGQEGLSIEAWSLTLMRQQILDLTRLVRRQSRQNTANPPLMG
jgi:hypothetical protein